ncbi:MAG: MFS transporter [Nitrososphaerota archaeon]|nr:MFS transporter [Nitrososphaerota archaeon]
MTEDKSAKKGDAPSSIGDDPSLQVNGQHTGWLNRTVIGVSLTSFFSDMSHEMATAILPFFIVAIGGNAAVVGLVEGASDGASSAVKSYSGHFSDKIGRRTPIMYMGYLLTGVLIPAIGLATSWIEVLLLRVAGWMGRGARGPPRDALLSESVPQESIGKAFGFQRSFDTIGAIIGVGLALILVPYLSYSRIFFVSFVPGVISVAVVFLLVKDIRRNLVIKPKSFRSSMAGLPRTFKLFLIPVGLFGIANFSNVLFTLRAQQVLQPVLGLKGADYLAILLYLILNVVYALSSYASGFFADKISKKYLLASGYVFFALACFASMFETSKLPILLMIFILAGVSVGIVDPIEGAFAARLLPDSDRGTGYGALQTVNGIGDFMSSTMVGVLWTLLTPAIGFASVASIAIIAAGLLLALIRTSDH